LSVFTSLAWPDWAARVDRRKLRGGGDKIETLIINAAECEPYITADDRLMQDCARRLSRVSASCPYSAACSGADRH
jgi:hypothetical protein